MNKRIRFSLYPTYMYYCKHSSRWDPNDVKHAKMNDFMVH